MDARLRRKSRSVFSSIDNTFSPSIHTSPASVVVEASRYLAPYVAVWKIKSQQGKFFWVLSGDLPADYVPFDVAPDARGALRHFSLSWQLKAENIMQAQGLDETQENYAKLLADRAISLHQLSERDDLF